MHYAIPLFTAYSISSHKKECALAHSRAEARLPRQPSTPAPSAHPRGAFIIVWKRSFLYDNKDARISPDTSQLVFLPYLRLPVNARNQLLCIIGHSSFIVLKFCLSYSVCLSCMRPCHLHTYFQVLPLTSHTAKPYSHWH